VSLFADNRKRLVALHDFEGPYFPFEDLSQVRVGTDEWLLLLALLL
jgi:hypothetical protein